jgi:hypothetical protein
VGVRKGVLAEPDTRKHLIEEWHYFYATYVRVALDGSEEFGRYAHDALWPRLAALESGAAVEFRRMDLPDGHGLQAPWAGHPLDPLWIDEHDVVHIGHQHDAPTPSYQYGPVRNK